MSAVVVENGFILIVYLRVLQHSITQNNLGTDDRIEIHHHVRIFIKGDLLSVKHVVQFCTGDGTVDGLTEELNHLSRVFWANGYPHAVTAGVLNKRRRCPPTRTEDETQKMLVLP